MVYQYSPDPPDETPEIKPVPSLQNDHLGGDSNDESDEDDGFEYDGYEPIPVAPDLVESSYESDDDIDNASAVAPEISNLPTAPSIDEEILKEIWSTPSVATIPMDAAKEDQIRSAMANFTLPASSIPEWAAVIPDEDFKKQLQDWIKQQKIQQN